MKVPQFDIAESCREALRIFSEGAMPEAKTILAERWLILKRSGYAVIESCDRSKEGGQVVHDAVLLFLCGVEDLEKYHRTLGEEAKHRLFTEGVRKLHFARQQYEQTA